MKKALAFCVFEIGAKTQKRNLTYQYGLFCAFNKLTFIKGFMSHSQIVIWKIS